MEQAGDSFLGLLGDDSSAGLEGDVAAEEDSQALEKLQVREFKQKLSSGLSYYEMYYWL